MRELEIAPPQFPKDLIREPRLEMSDIFAVRALVMGYLRKRARTKRVVPLERKHLLTILDNQTLGKDQAAYDGSRDTYLSCKVQKVQSDQWRMLVSFLETHNTEEAFATYRRQTYFFDWLRSGNRQAWFTDVLRRRTDEGLYYQVNATSPVDSDACLELQNQMLAVSQKANPISSNSIFVPNLDKEKA